MTILEHTNHLTVRFSILYIVIFTLTSSSVSYGQCNGSSALCSKQYDEVAYLTTHNAYNAGTEGFALPNQNYGLTQQLNEGVRALMLDVHDLNGTPTVYHGTSILGSVPFQSNLTEIRTFLENNPYEIVTVILECYVSSAIIESEIVQSGLFDYLYTKPPGSWNTLQEMIDSNDRLVILTDVNDAGINQQWYHYAWDLCVETHYTVNDVNDFTNDYNRGDAQNDLFIFNHFVTNSITGTGMQNEAQIVNDYDFLMPRIQQHFNAYAKFPNFITLDFYELGDGKEVVDSLNTQSFELSIPEASESSVISIHPNPANDHFIINGLKYPNSYTIRILDLSGNTVKVFKSKNSISFTAGIQDIPTGMYVVQLADQNGFEMHQRLVIN